MQKFIQITDCHLFATEEGKLLGMDTHASLDAVMSKMHQEQSQFDFYLCTGDLSQDGSIESYQYLKDLLDKDGKEHFWIPGNHDYRTNMLQVVSEQKEMLSVVKKGPWQLILLDSQVPGSVFGNLAQSQLDLLEEALQQDTTSHTLITMHHHPRPMGCKWLDTQQIRNSQALLDIVDKYDNVRVVLWGHVHQDSDTTINGVRYISTPSTCVQFTPESNDFDVDKVGPGYRWMELNDDGSINTGVSRVEGIDFEIDYSIKGY
ncbi:MAG: 3',5'-cyclic-AMP phosphodiesterase [Gammaproteobacteria bacterium]|nr:3',5'-cyclic-AMP phosphodiesterase [Gammaproteobacteria bacterium]